MNDELEEEPEYRICEWQKSLHIKQKEKTAYVHFLL